MAQAPRNSKDSPIPSKRVRFATNEPGVQKPQDDTSCVDTSTRDTAILPSRQPMRTRDLLAAKEEQLNQLNLSSATSEHTRLRLAEVEAAIARRQMERTATLERAHFLERQNFLKKLMRENSFADLVFMMDCSGSMRLYLEAVKDQIFKIILRCVQEFDNKMRIGFVGYRDHYNGNDRIVSVDLTDDHLQVVEALRAVKDIRNNDTAEDVFGGLEAVTKLTWQHPNRVLIHIGDAPQHGTRFTGGEVDDLYSSFNDADPRGLTIEGLIAGLKDLNVHYYFAKLQSSTDIMISEFQKVAGSPNFIKEIKLDNPEEILSFAVASVAKTIQSNLQNVLSDRTLRMGPASVKDFTIEKEVPDKNSCALIGVKWLEYRLPENCTPGNIQYVFENIGHKWTTQYMRKARNPFAEGTQRVSFHGWRMNSEEIVIKEFKEIKGRDPREDYINIMETQAIAAFLASEFNKVVPPATKAVTYLEVSVVQAIGSDGSPVYYNVEKQLPNYAKNFTKWNNNAGYVNYKSLAEILEAFSHWTHAATNGYLMVVDIQGVDHETGYVLTDPSIHSADYKFGKTNFGELGIKAFFQTHRCNKICEALKLKPSLFQRILSYTNHILSKFV